MFGGTPTLKPSPCIGSSNIKIVASGRVIPDITKIEKIKNCFFIKLFAFYIPLS